MQDVLEDLVLWRAASNWWLWRTAQGTVVILKGRVQKVMTPAVVYWHQLCIVAYLSHDWRLNNKQTWQITSYIWYSVLCLDNLFCIRPTSLTKFFLLPPRRVPDRCRQLNVTIICGTSQSVRILTQAQTNTVRWRGDFTWQFSESIGKSYTVQSCAICELKPYLCDLDIGFHVDFRRT